jgi:hypothetical protein
MADFIPDVAGEPKLSIAQQCADHSQTMCKFSSVLINLGTVEQRQDGFEARLAKLEKTRDEKLDLIIDMLKRMI